MPRLPEVGFIRLPQIVGDMKIPGQVKVFKLTVWVLVVIVALIFGTGIAHLMNKSYLSDAVLIALISFAGVNMLGAFLIILRYLFSK